MKRKFLTFASIIVFAAVLIFAYVEVKWVIPPRNISRLRSEIYATAHTEATNISSCQQTVIGYKTCGGGTDYLVYSTESTDVTKLQSLANEYYAAQKKFSQSIGGGSTCDAIVPRLLSLENNHCVAKDFLTVY